MERRLPYEPVFFGVRQKKFSDLFFNSIVDAMADGVFTMDMSGRILFWNPATERISGYCAEEALGQSC